MPRKSWWARLPFGVRMTAGATALLLVVGGGTAAVAALLGGDEPATRIVTAVGQPAQAAPATGEKPAEAPHRAAVAVPPPVDDEVAALPRTAGQADRTATRAPRQAKDDAPRKAAPAPVTSAAPVVTTREETETREIPFRTRLVSDPALARGAKRVQAEGMPGEETLRYLVTVVDGKPAERRLVETRVTREPQHRVVAYGTATAEPRPECGKPLAVCVPLGRSAHCGKGKKDRREESAVRLGGSLTVLDQDVAGLDAEALAALRVC